MQHTEQQRVSHTTQLAEMLSAALTQVCRILSPRLAHLRVQLSQPPLQGPCVSSAPGWKKLTSAACLQSPVLV